MQSPETRYARNGDISIAYQVVGDGPMDVVVVPGFVTNLELAAEFPAFQVMIRRYTAFSRLIRFDKRGTGLSDRSAGVASLEERMDDVRAVMDAVGSERAALVGVSEGGPMAVLFAATYPERTTALVLWSTFARVVRTDDYPIGFEPGPLREFWERVVESWGTGRTIARFFPDAPDEPWMKQMLARMERNSAGPGAVRKLVDMWCEIDVGDVLPTVQVPTLVLHGADDAMVPPAMGRYLADRIPGAVYVEVPGGGHGTAGLGEGEDPWLDAIEEFLTGRTHVAESERVLLTVLFTDIVDSTARAAELGDAEWKLLLDRHDRVVERQIERFRGSLVKTTGDGVLATFDGPARAMRCAAAIRHEAEELGIPVRAGLHTGEVELRGSDIGGIAVHLAQRVSALAGEGEILVSSTVKDLVIGAGLDFAERGEHELKGVPGSWRLYEVTGV